MKNGELIEYYESGVINYKIYYYTSGEISSKINYLDGKLHGESIYYFPCGEISSSRNYLDDNLHGELTRYNINGVVLYKCWYLYGESVTELEWLSYDRNIKLELIGL